MGKFYAIKKGRQTGIFSDSWDKVQPLVSGFPGAIYKGFSSYTEAQKWFHEEELTVPSLPGQQGLVVYTDGSCMRGKGGYGVVITYPDGTHTCHRGNVPYTPCTNQIAELYAIKIALRLVQESSFILRTDSKYSIGCLTEWLITWKRNGFLTSGREPVMNRELIESIDLLRGDRDIKFEWIRGHNGDPFNEICDRLAKEGVDLV